MNINQCIEVLENIRDHYGDETFVCLSVGGDELLMITEVKGGIFTGENSKGESSDKPLAVFFHIPPQDI